MKKIYFVLAFLSVTGFALANNGETGCNGETEKKKKITTDPILSGSVVDASTKKPLSDVTVSIKSANKTEKNITTDASGNFKLNQLPQGKYTVKFEKNNYTIKEHFNLVISGSSIKLNVELNQEDAREEARNVWDKHGFF